MKVSKTIPKRIKHSIAWHHKPVHEEHGGYVSLDRHGKPINDTVYYSYETAQDAGGRVVRYRFYQKNLANQ